MANLASGLPTWLVVMPRRIWGVAVSRHGAVR
jgi:hypothetical protein